MERLLNGRYRVGTKIGDGGMAIVYRGFDTSLGRSVAIKVLREQYSADRTFVARFEREAQAIATLVHPNIINIFDVGFDRDPQTGMGIGHYFVMELVEGPNLKELIRARGALPIAETVAIITQVLAGLGVAHARGLVHRDIKPQNILLTPDGTAKVTDFGIAKGLADATLTDAGFGMGTVHYISPEQARGEPATPLSDLYAVGVMLYEMLTGVLPFTGDSTVGVALKHVQEAPLSPKRLNDSIPAPLAAITVRALAKNPNDRFTDAREMAAAVADWPHWRDRRGPLAPAVQPNSRTGVQNRRSAAVVPAARPSRGVAGGGVGWLTWVLGAILLVGLVGLLIVGYMLSPFGAQSITPTQTSIAGLPTEVPPPPTATANMIAPSPSPAVPGVPAPTVATPRASVRPTQTALVGATATAAAPQPTATAASTATPVAPTATTTPILVAVPDLTGRTLTEARAIASAAGLTVEQVGAQYSERPAGQIVSQQPAAGRQLARGGTITIILSRGPQTVTVPDVKGQGYNQAAQQLEAVGLVATRNDVSSRNVPAGIVIDQDPLGGNTAQPGALVTLTVSIGDVAQVPDLFGDPVEIARQRLVELGFVVNINGQTKAQIEAENPSFFKVYPTMQDGQVISQSQPPGAFVPRGSTISIAYYKAR